MSYYPQDMAKSGAQRQRQKLSALENAVADAARELATMSAMLTGSASLDASYTTLSLQYGYADNTAAHAAYDLIAAGVGRLVTDAPVDNVASSLATMCNSLRE